MKDILLILCGSLVIIFMIFTIILFIIELAKCIFSLSKDNEFSLLTKIFYNGCPVFMGLWGFLTGILDDYSILFSIIFGIIGFIFFGALFYGASGLDND